MILQKTDKARITVEIDGKIHVKVYEVRKTNRLTKKERNFIKKDNPPGAKIVQYTTRVTRVWPEWELNNNK